MRPTRRWNPGRLREWWMARRAPQQEDRRVLEEVIFPEFLRDPGVRAVLFVGCDWYTRSYERRCFRGCDYWTLEPDPDRRHFGARQHVVAPLESLREHFPESRFDWIICNGVFGWGLDGREQCELAFSACFSCLRPGGRLLLGWNELREREPFPPEELSSLQRFLLTFFGEPAMTNTGASRIARMSGATIVPLFFCRLVRFHPPLEDVPSEDLVHDTRVLTTILEGFVRECPAQYFWTHRKFKGRPPPYVDPY